MARYLIEIMYMDILALNYRTSVVSHSLFGHLQAYKDTADENNGRCCISTPASRATRLLPRCVSLLGDHSTCWWFDAGNSAGPSSDSPLRRYIHEYDLVSGNIG